jgi:hypothetical protein
MGKNCNKNIDGMRFGKLTAIEIDHKDGYHEFWKCHCDCGNDTIVKKAHLLNGATNSCGCIRRERVLTHGKSETKLYGVWAGIKRRCYNKNQAAYKNYGGRGISLCADWFDFSHFYKWAIDNGYKEGLSIDRIDNNGNYEPKNCRWVDDSTQANNTRVVKRISYHGETLTYMEWSRKLGAKRNIVWKRIVMQGWNEIKAITTPIITPKE